jgi:hypothetical protein
MLTFEKHAVFISLTSGLKMETACFSETLASTEESKRRRKPEEHHNDRYMSKNWKFQVKE